MLVVLLLAVVAAAFLLGARGRSNDLPERIVVTAANWLPAHQRAWGLALIAELAAVQGRRQRWAFAAGAVRIALSPPASPSTPARATAAVAGATTLIATVTTITVLPTLSVFIAVLGLLTTGYATALARRYQRLAITRAQLAAGAPTVAGVLAATSAVIAVAATHPAATRDPTHVYSIALAVVLCGYLIAGLSATGSRTGTSSTTRATLWGACAGATATLAGSVVMLPRAAGVSGPIPLAMAAATLATAIIVSAITRSQAAGARAGLRAAILSAPIQFTLTIIALQHARPHTLTSAYDIAAYPRSGYPDVASYLLSDALGGNIVTLAITPLAMYALATVGAAAATHLRGSVPAGP